MSSTNSHFNSSNINNNLKSFKSNSKLLFNKLLNNINTSDSFNDLNNSSMNLGGTSSNSTSHSALNVITSAAAAAVSSIHSMISHNNNGMSSSLNTGVSSSSSSSSSAQHTPTNQMDEFMNINSSQHLNNLNMLRSSLSTTTKIEKKHFEKINKMADKILKNCQSEKMNLINSPPYIIDILPDICQIFNTISVIYENKLHLLNDIEYFCILMRNCLDKFQQLIDLFKIAGKKMYEETSEERQKLIKYTLVFSHILAEMKSIFPRDIYEGQSYRIAKKDAEDFWKANFNERIIVSWKEFEIKLNRVHKISSPSESDLIRETIQLTKSRHVSIFEFDIFTRLFQPWNNLLNNWKFLVTEHPAYSAFSTYDEVHRRLQKHINKPGSYLFRLSCTKLGQWAIGYVTSDRKILQTIPQSLVQALIDGQKQNLYLYPDGRDIKIDISSAIAVTSASRIQMSKEQFEQYCDVGLSFQVCKICAENNKDRKLEPCGHLICSSCLENWQEQHSVPSCPFCRCEIKTFEPIIISPFEQKINKKISSSQLLNENKNILNEMSNINNNMNDLKLDSKINNKNTNLAVENDENSSVYLKPVESNLSVSNNVKINNNDIETSNGDDVYLTPNNNNKSPVANSNSSKPDQSKYNSDALIKNDVLINEKPKTSNTNNKDATSVLTQISPPLVLPPPLLPPPPPPPPSISTLPRTKSSTNIVNGNHMNGHHANPNIISSSFGKNSIQLKVENEHLFDQLVSLTIGNDKIKAACALMLTNNDINKAKEILLLSNNL